MHRYYNYIGYCVVLYFLFILCGSAVIGLVSIPSDYSLMVASLELDEEYQWMLLFSEIFLAFSYLLLFFAIVQIIYKSLKKNFGKFFVALENGEHGVEHDQ